MPTQRIIQAAIAAARESQLEFTVGGVLYRGSSIIKTACNEIGYIGYRRNVFKFLPTRHAEILLLHNVSREVLRECDMLVVRISRKGELVSAKPCSGCFAAICKSAIRRVWYSNYNGEIIRLNLDPTQKYEKEKPFVST